MNSPDSWPVEREATWLYAGSVLVCIRVLASPEMWGTGDYEDEESVAENQAVPCYFLAYESAGSPGVFNNLVPNIETLERAIEAAEEKFPGLVWLAS